MATLAGPIRNVWQVEPVATLHIASRNMLPMEWKIGFTQKDEKNRDATEQSAI
jgi:hypothetical protein